jgi:uncharacterized protein with GYD domain
MPHYVILWNWTDQGIKAVKDSPNRLTSFGAQLEKLGGKLVGEYYTMGKYDGVVIVDAPSDETIMSIMLGNASKGNFRSMALKAFPMSETGKIIERR